MTDSIKQAQAQALLADARKLLQQAGELAEEGKFTLQFMKSNYYPNSVYKDWDQLTMEQKAHRVGALELGVALSDLTKDQADEIDAIVGDDFYIPEYAATGRFWSPSTC